MVLFNELLKLVREENARRGYEEVKTPILTDIELWRRSGHWDKYRDNMYFTEIDEREMGLKPMNCPGHTQIYANERHSYRDLPIRYSEAGLVHRHEASGVLHGLLRVRAFTQDDAHIFCTEEQIEEEVLGCLDLGFRLYDHFDLEPRLELSTRPEQRLGSDEMWDHAEGALRAAMERQGLEYEIGEGEGTFYGPKIDVHMTDSIGRSWQLGTVQLDYQMPERFGLTYTGADDEPHQPVMIHRAMLGSYERFIGILIEHYAGAFPVWLAPVQAIVLPIAERHNAHAESMRARLLEKGLRAEIDERDEKVGRKVRDAEVRKIPYLLVVGDREADGDAVSVRRHGVGDEGTSPVEAFVNRLATESYTRAR
jgi:threonyl-tRNA synthetase